MKTLSEHAHEKMRALMADYGAQCGSQYTGDCTGKSKTDTGAMLWHDDMRWSGPDRLAFTAGLSGQQTPFVYDVETKSLKSTEKLSSTFRAVIRNGPVSPTGTGGPSGKR